MKKLFALLLVLSMAAALCACEGVTKLDIPELPSVDAEQPVESAEPALEPEATPQVSDSEGHVLVSIDRSIIQEYDPAQGEHLILTFAYDPLTVVIEGRPQASDKINAYVDMLDETYYTGNDYGGGEATGFNMMLELAQDNYAYIVNAGIEDAIYEFACSRAASVTRADSSVLSIVYNDYRSTGGAHPTYGDTGYVFDTQTGELVTISMLAPDADTLRTGLVEEMIALAEADASYAERIDENMLPDGSYAEAFESLLSDGSWYFDHEGMVVFAAPDTIAPHAAGQIEFHIPYLQLKGLIDDKWIPEYAEAQGDITVKPVSEVTDGTVEVLDKVSASADGSEMYLIVEGTIYDVKLSRVDYADSFYEIAELWHCSYMTDSALQLVTDIPDGMPNLMLSYYTSDGTQCSKLISQSGMDGSLILMDAADIEAVG